MSSPVNTRWIGIVVKLGVVMGPLAVIVFGLMLTLPSSLAASAPVSRDLLLEPSRTTETSLLRTPTALPSHLTFVANGSTYWYLQRGSVNLDAVQAQVHARRGASSRPLPVSQVAVLEFDAKTQTLKSVYPR